MPRPRTLLPRTLVLLLLVVIVFTESLSASESIDNGSQMDNLSISLHADFVGCCQ
jgi:hypothetical protein